MRCLTPLLLILLLAACGSGAVVFAPTPPPPDLSPLLYRHPSGAFSVSVPRRWSVYVQNVTTLASAAFAPPDVHDPVARFSVINLGQRVDAARLGAIIDHYQTMIRPSVARYTEASRQAMGDGSWRLTGLQTTPGGLTHQLNTFIQTSGSLLGVAEIVIPDDAASLPELQTIVNSFKLEDAANLQPAEPDTLGLASANSLDLLHVTAWTTPAGVLFITGEVANTGAALVADVPVRAVLWSAQGLALAEAVDTVMGYGIPPGGFAPFSLRFGQGQPALTASYELSLGGADWLPDATRAVYGPEVLSWTDSSEIGADGQLIITGSVTNTGAQTINQPVAVVTVFDSAQNVIAAGFSQIESTLAPGQTTSFQMTVPETGGQPANYILNLQGLP